MGLPYLHPGVGLVGLYHWRDMGNPVHGQRRRDVVCRVDVPGCAYRDLDYRLLQET